MATQDQNPNQNLGNQPSSQSNPQNESVRSDKQDRGLEQNDHTHESENDVTHAPKRTGEPENQERSNSRSQDAASDQDKTTPAGYAQNEHDKTPEADAEDTNASDPRESKEPKKGSL